MLLPHALDAGAVTPLAVLLLALALDAALGDPAWLYRALPHPVALMGGAIGALERRLNRPGGGALKLRGALALALVVGLVGTLAWLLAWGLRALAFGWIAEALLASTLIAQRGLHQHVGAVARALQRRGLEAGREAVAHIAGRDPGSLDEPGVCRAAIESCAENFSDGVVAPAFWYALFGLPGLAVYKAVNTADSMIGHRSPRYAGFGWAAARLDDVTNLAPARLAGALIALAAAGLRESPGGAAGAMRRDAARHRSPNAGWPEAAMAGALGLRLAGPRRYGGEVVDDAWMGAGNESATPADVRRALSLLVAACALAWALVAALALAHQLA